MKKQKIAWGNFIRFLYPLKIKKKQGSNFSARI
jgi:hypothetical protein